MTPPQPPFALTVSAEARAVMTPMLDPAAQPPITPAMLLDPAALAMIRAGVPVDLRVYEGMMHAFWAWIECPETELALAAQAAFLAEHVRG